MKEPILEVRNIAKKISGKPILQGLSFSLHEGEIVGLLGHNGAGKTTAFYSTIGLVRPDEGEIFFQGENITKMPMYKRALLGIGYLSQEPSLFRSLTVEENILCVLETLKKTKEEKKLLLEQALEELHISHLAKKKTQVLSGGEKRRVEIARALVRSPKVLLLDEPFANIDPITIQDVKNLAQMLRSKGIAIFITDHNAREIFTLVDRSYLMASGQIIAAGGVSALLENPRVQELYLGKNFSL